MKPIVAIVLALLCLTPISVRAVTPPSKDVSPLLAPIIQKHDVPGIAAAVVRNGEIVALGVTGVRTRGKGDKIATADRFHIGSDTKAMTAMLCGIFVDERNAGSNTLWFAVAWLAPKKDFAVLVACNQANAEARNDAAIGLIVDHFKGERR